jgi:hypothetical protein
MHFASTLKRKKRCIDEPMASLLPLTEKSAAGLTASLWSPHLDDASDWRLVFDWTWLINLGHIVCTS